MITHYTSCQQCRTVSTVSTVSTVFNSYSAVLPPSPMVFFSREGNFGQRRQMEKKKKKNWEDKEGNIFTEEKEGQGKGAIVTWLDIKGTTRTGKNAGSACIAIYANFLVIALISIFLEQKVPCFMFYKKEYDVYYTFKTYFIHFKRPWALQQLLQNQS